MALVTYPSRALPLLAPGIERLPRRALTYLQLVGPSVLAALVAVNVMIVLDTNRRPDFNVGIEWLAVVVAVAMVAWRRNLFLGIVAAVVVAAAARAAGLA